MSFHKNIICMLVCCFSFNAVLSMNGISYSTGPNKQAKRLNCKPLIDAEDKPIPFHVHVDPRIFLKISLLKEIKTEDLNYKDSKKDKGQIPFLSSLSTHEEFLADWRKDEERQASGDLYFYKKDVDYFRLCTNRWCLVGPFIPNLNKFKKIIVDRNGHVLKGEFEISEDYSFLLKMMFNAHVLPIAPIVQLNNR